MTTKQIVKLLKANTGATDMHTVGPRDGGRSVEREDRLRVRRVSRPT